MTEKKQGICPKGWHVPGNQEWIDLFANLNISVDKDNSIVDGASLKASLNYWTNKDNNVIGANATRFNALPGGGRFYAYSGSYATYAGINSRNGYNDINIRGWWWTSSTTETLYSFWHATSTSYVMQYMPYYIRMDQDGKTYFNINTRTDNYAFLTNTIFHSSVHYYILDGSASNNGNALDRVKSNFYMSVRCVRD